jgi:3-deoxy-D-manno-octulosonic-acid transferase
VPYLLNLVYIGLIAAVSPWLALQAFRKGKYRQGYAQKFLGLVPRRVSDAKCVWLHAVSVGEVNLLDSLIERLSQTRPEWQCVVSTTTMTGMALAKKKYPQLTVFYCPLDFTWAVKTAVRRVRPDVLVLAELELWPNLIGFARRSGARVAVINGRLSERSTRGYGRIRPLVARLLGRIDLLAVQNETYAERFLALGAPPRVVSVTGSMKYDGAQTDRQNRATQTLRQLAGFADNEMVFLAGSTQEPEETLALDAYRKLHEKWPQLRLVLVPRHPDRFDAVAKMLNHSGVSWQRRTDLDHQNKSSSARVLLVDVVGELGAWWGTAQIAFVGGSMGSRGGQNMIEPAAYGAAVCFGPKTRNFRDVVTAMLDHGAAVVVENGPELTDFVSRCLEDTPYRTALGNRATQFVAQQLGATDRTLELLVNLDANHE